MIKFIIDKIMQYIYIKLIKDLLKGFCHGRILKAGVCAPPLRSLGALNNYNT